MGYSVKLKMYRRDVRKDGTCGIYLQVIIDRRKLDIGLGLNWPPGKFTDNVGCRPRFKGDIEANDFNLIIGRERSKANTVLLTNRLRELPIDIDIFKRDFYSNMNKNDFISFFSEKAAERHSKGLISNTTYKQERVTIAKLKKFSETLPFNSFHSTWGQEFDLYLRKEYNNGQNTLWSVAKRIKTYLALAADSGMSFIDPYKKFTVAQVKSRFKALSKSQFMLLVSYYQSDKITPVRKTILRRFLFGCCSGLRISDLRSLTKDEFKDGRMSLSPQKTLKFGTHIDAVPLNDMALTLLSEEMQTSDHKLFYKYTEQYTNRTLKDIALDIGLDHDLHNHISRSTFASLYDQAGGNHRSLMEYLGLKRAETLAKYVHTNNEVIASDIDKLNKSLGFNTTMSETPEE